MNHKGNHEDKNSREKKSIKATRMRYHACILFAALLIIALAGLLRLNNSGEVKAPFWGTLPGICTWKNLIGVDCPGCGLTRCFVEIAHGKWSNGWKFNPAGFLIFGMVIYQIPFRGLQLWRLKTGKQDCRHNIYLVNVVAWGIVVALFTQWVLRHVQ